MEHSNKYIKSTRHAELVSASHMLSIQYNGDLFCGVLKQVQHDIFFSISP